MNNKEQWSEGFSVYIDEWRECCKTQNLVGLEEKYLNLISTRASIFEWAERLYLPDGSPDFSAINKFSKLENSLWEETNGLPIFDEESLFDCEEQFYEHEAYYRRYGCDMPEYIVSWDKSNVLVWDGDVGCQIIPRPDVLMGNL